MKIRLALIGLTAGLLVGCGGGVETGASTDSRYVAQDTNITSDDRKPIVKRHNDYRQMVATNKDVKISDLKWDKDLALHAQTWANYLAANYTNDDASAGKLPHARHFQISKHSEDDYYEGENIARYTKYPGMVRDEKIDIFTQEYNQTRLEKENVEIVDAWASEGYYYLNNKKPTAGLTTGHFTQLVWADTKKVGCGMATSSVYKENNSYYVWIVCRYDPWGNVYNENPY